MGRGARRSQQAGAAARHGPDPKLLELWGRFMDPRTREEELDFRVEHWRILNGSVLPFDADEFRRMEERIIDHAGTHRNPAAHARAGQDGLERGAELEKVRSPVLVIEAPQDPINPPPHSSHLAKLIPGAKLVTIDGMGHAIGTPVIAPLAEAILSHTIGAPRWPSPTGPGSS